MDLILMPMLVSLVAVGLFSVAVLIGGTMLFGQKSAYLGNQMVVYSLYSLLGGLSFCWIGFALLLLLWSLERYSVRLGNVILSLPLVIFWLSGPDGILLGVILACRFCEGKR